MNISIIDESTALAALTKVREDLILAENKASSTMSDLRQQIVAARPGGVLTVDEMAAAVGRNRNYIDSVWSSHGETSRGHQTRVRVDELSEDRVKDEYRYLSDAAGRQRSAASDVVVARAERDRVVAMVYASKILGPSAIAKAVGIDRNHALRLARKAGVAAQYRATARNQHTVNKSA